jgi:ABC-type sugar transport system permease subunit
MCIATGLMYSVISAIYLQEATEFDPYNYRLPLNDLPKFLESLNVTNVFVVFAWTAEFSAKMSLLLFFRRLVDRFPRLILYMKFVMGFVTLVWGFLVCQPFILCSHFGTASASKCLSSLSIISPDH